MIINLSSISNQVKPGGACNGDVSGDLGLEDYLK